jgi:hypothetical protein
MKLRLLLFFLLFAIVAAAQHSDYQLQLKFNAFKPQSNVLNFNWEGLYRQTVAIQNKRWVIIQFQQTPTTQQVAQLKVKGVVLGEYIPPYAYVATIVGETAFNGADYGIRAINLFPAASKINPQLLHGNYPLHAVKQANTIDIEVLLSNQMAVDEAVQYLTSKGYRMIDTKWASYHVIVLRIAQQKLKDIIEEPFVLFVNPIHAPDKLLNDELRSNARANVLNAPIISGGENLMGSGVTIGHGDDGDITTHIDLKDRVINHTWGYPLNHATQTAGSAAGAGIKDPLYKGIAPKARLVAQNFSNIIWNAPAYVSDYNMVVTNNSYGAVLSECDYAGLYDAYSKIVDEQAFTLPNLLHVFATGNDGSLSCGNYLQGYKTVAGAYQSAKNSIAVAWGDKNATVSAGSSFGPVADGRLKPDIAATGSGVRSTGANNNYVTDWGSSLAAPAVMGGAALLIEKYKQLHGNAQPKSALIKALLLNGATDIGTAGPDYKSGYGWMNLLRSVDMLKQQRFVLSSTAHGNENMHNITIPTGVAQLKVMLYWHDPAAAVFATQSLVNDLDLKVVTPTNQTLLPWVLNPSAATVTNAATRGADHINNTEQVTIENPEAGTYQIKVNGFNINTNPTQSYVVVYDFISEDLQLTFPANGEPLVPNETVTINWDANGNSTSNFVLQYSTDNGASWSTITNTLAYTARQFIWNVPATITNQAKISIQWASMADTSLPFTVIPSPVVSVASLNEQCTGYAVFNWSAVSGATDYEVLLKNADGQYEHYGFTTSTNYAIRGIGTTVKAWVAVVARMNGVAGRRSIGVGLDGNNNGLCTGVLGDGDLMLQQLQLSNGRVGTATALTANTSIAGSIKNIGDATLANAKVMMQLNSNPTVEIASWPVVNANASLSFTSSSSFDLSTIGTYALKGFVSHNASDPFVENDTISLQIKQLPNPPIVLPFTENFESADVAVYTKNRIGLNGLDKWDFSFNGDFGRARTFVNTGIARSGSKAITLDVAAYSVAGTANSLSGTFNLYNYDTALHDVRLDFWFKHHGQSNNAFNKVWVRGNDASVWIECYHLDSQKTFLAGEWKQAKGLSVTALLKANQQQFSSSFQIRFGQKGNFSMGDNNSTEGFTFDDISLYTVQHDVALLTVQQPLQQACGLGNAEQVIITVKNNSAATLLNVPVHAQLNGGTVFTTVVTTLLPNATAQVAFPTTFNLSALGQHNLTVYTAHASDTYNANDTIVLPFINQPVINTFPYLQQFEQGQGNWYSQGDNNSWQFGTPNSLKINKAASGINAWKTTLRGNYNDNEKSYLYSPCFNISSLNNPWLSASMAVDIEQCGQSVCDKAWVEYSNDGITWLKLGAFGQGTNWYNRNNDHVWDSASFKRWHVVSIPLPLGLTNLRIRFVMQSDMSVVREGMAIDDIHIYDQSNGIYSGATMQSPVTQQVSGNSWIDFLQAGQLLASIQPQQNNLGATSVQTYKYTSSFNTIRFANGHYYLNRNITVQPTNNNIADSVAVKLYFTDAEVDTVTRATGCSNCTTTKDAYELSITQFDATNNTNENGTLADNTTGTYNYISNSNLQIIPFDKGYYASFKTKSFSEFWWSSGNIGSTPPLPLIWNTIQLRNVNGNIEVTWTTLQEQGIAKFEVELAVDEQAYQLGNFKRIGTLAAKNGLNNAYLFYDTDVKLSSTRYYRIKMIGMDGSSTYSVVRSITLPPKVDWVIVPNPTNDWLHIVTSAKAGMNMVLSITDMKGKRLYRKVWSSTGLGDKQIISLQALQIPAGIYAVSLSNTVEQKVFKLIKQ